MYRTMFPDYDQVNVFWFIKTVKSQIVLTLKVDVGVKNNFIFIYACVCKNYTC